MTFQILFLFLGFGLLIKGAGWLVDGASSLAKKYNISDLSIGLTIVAFGTSAPELIVSIFASFQNHQDIVFGNVIGSNNFNLFVILGITGIITPLVVKSSTVWKEIPISFAAIVFIFILSNDHFGSRKQLLSRIDGLILLIMFSLFLYYVYKQLKSEKIANHINGKAASNFKLVSTIIIGLTLLVVGGRLVVSNAVLMANYLGISETIIGLTIVAAGTSLPELATSIAAAMKKNVDIAVGNIIGSNIFNIFLILGASSIIKPIGYNNAFNVDITLLSVGTIILFIAMFTGNKRKLDRLEAGLLLSIYVGYTIYLILKPN